MTPSQLIKAGLLRLRARPPVLLQERLLTQALAEVGVGKELVNLTIDHLNGCGSVCDVPVGLVYPRSFFSLARLLGGAKRWEYYFNGAMTQEGGRAAMLAPYSSRADSLVVSSLQGRNERAKGSFNVSYYREMRAARFALCPHQADWPGPRSTTWTYRFVEACMCGALPVLFRATPLGREFTAGFHYYLDDEAHVYREDWAEENLCLAIERFTLSNASHLAILAAIESAKREGSIGR